MAPADLLRAAEGLSEPPADVVRAAGALRSTLEVHLLRGNLCAGCSIPPVAVDWPCVAVTAVAGQLRERLARLN